MLLIEVPFWILVGLILYTYFGYPAVLWVLSAFKGRKPLVDEDACPSLTLLISAHNEEKVMAEKLANSLALDYPRDRLEIIVASNGSTDATDQLA